MKKHDDQIKFESQKISIKSKDTIEQVQVSEEPAPICSSSLDSDLESHIRDYFLNPLKELIANDGVSNGYLIANVDALGVMKQILKAILKRKKISITEILEKAAFEEEDTDAPSTEECVSSETLPEEIACENSHDASVVDEDEEEDDDEENEEEDDDEEDDEEDDFDEYDLEEARECDSYAYDEDESMDG